MTRAADEPARAIRGAEVLACVEARAGCVAHGSSATRTGPPAPSPSASDGLLEPTYPEFEERAEENEKRRGEPDQNEETDIAREPVHGHLVVRTRSFRKASYVSASAQGTNGHGVGASASAAMAPKCSMRNRSPRYWDIRCENAE